MRSRRRSLSSEEEAVSIFRLISASLNAVPVEKWCRQIRRTSQKKAWMKVVFIAIVQHVWFQAIKVSFCFSLLQIGNSVDQEYERYHSNERLSSRVVWNRRIKVNFPKTSVYKWLTMLNIEWPQTEITIDVWKVHQMKNTTQHMFMKR